MKLDNDARLRHDFSQYRAMLKELRRSEESFEDGSKIAYLLQVGKHADSVTCKMFRYKRDRDNFTYLHFQVLRSEDKYMGYIGMCRCERYGFKQFTLG